MHRLALDPPPGPLTLLTEARVDDAIAAARESPRQRIIAPFHVQAENTLHRMLNAVEPGSYIRPHRHLDPPKDEAWLVLRGELVFFTFEDDGQVRDAVTVRAGGPVFGVDLHAGVYHTFIARTSGTVIYEVKPGPYTPTSDKAFAPWAPPEGSSEAAAYMARLLATCAMRGAQKRDM